MLAGRMTRALFRRSYLLNHVSGYLGGQYDDRGNLLRRSRPPSSSAFAAVSIPRGTRPRVIPPMSFISAGAGCFPLFSWFPPVRLGYFLENHVCGTRFGYNVTLSSFRCSDSLSSSLFLRSLVHQLFDALITQHHLHQRALRLPFLDISEGEFDGVEMKTVVVGFWRMTVAPGVTTRRLA